MKCHQTGLFPIVVKFQCELRRKSGWVHIALLAPSELDGAYRCDGKAFVMAFTQCDIKVWHDVIIGFVRRSVSVLSNRAR